MNTAAKRYRTLTHTVLALLVCVNLVALFLEMGIEWDFANFYDAGRKVAAGEAINLYDPHTDIAGEPSLGKMTFSSTPLSAVFYTPLSVFSPSVSMFAFKLQNVLAYLAALWLLLVHCRRYVASDEAAQSRFVLAFVSMLVVYQPFWTIYRVGGQTTPTILLLLMVGWLLHARGAFWGSAAVLVFIVTIKPVFLTMFAFVALTSGIAFIVPAAVFSLAAAGTSVALLSWPVHERFIVLMLKLSGRSTAWVYNSALTVPIDTLHLAWDPSSTVPATPAISAASMAVRLAVVACVVLVYLRSRGYDWTDPQRRHFNWALALMFTLLTAPIVWEHYLSFLFLPLAFLVANHGRISRTALVMVVLIVGLAAFQNIIIASALWDAMRGVPWPLHFAVAVVKAAPLLLTLALLCTQSESLLEAFGTLPRGESRGRR